jgi:hypothetical protein
MAIKSDKKLVQVLIGISSKNLRAYSRNHLMKVIRTKKKHELFDLIALRIIPRRAPIVEIKV